MTAAHGLSDGTVDQIARVLRRFPSVHKALLFGSRAKGVHKRGSDIDLALAGAGLDWKTLGQIEEALDDLLLPYRFSLITCDEHTDPDIAAHIQRVGYSFYTRGRARGRAVGSVGERSNQRV